jgi:hypothetical protein
MPKTALPVPGSDDPIALTDWLEATMLVEARTQVSRSWIRKALLATTFFDESKGPDDDVVSALDVVLEGIVREVRRRRRHCVGGYPYEPIALGQGVSLDITINGLVYAFMLLITVSGQFRDERRHPEVDEPFDLIVSEALTSYLGARSKAFRFGSPASGKRPKKFSAAIAWAATTLGLRPGSGTTRGHTGDGGVDIIGWLPFADGRECFLTFLVQCTIQLKWESKGADIVPEQWVAWIDFGKEPVTGLAIPFIIPPDFPKWDEVRRTVGFIFERLRIAALARSLPASLRKTVWAWTSNELQTLGGRKLDMFKSWA